MWNSTVYKSKAVLLKCLTYPFFIGSFMHGSPITPTALFPQRNTPNNLPKCQCKFDINTGSITHHTAEWKTNSEEALNRPGPIWVFLWFLKTKISRDEENLEPLSRLGSDNRKYCISWELQTHWYLSPYSPQSLVLNNHPLLEEWQ